MLCYLFWLETFRIKKNKFFLQKYLSWPLMSVYSVCVHNLQVKLRIWLIHRFLMSSLMSNAPLFIPLNPPWEFMKDFVSDLRDESSFEFKFKPKGKKRWLFYRDVLSQWEWQLRISTPKTVDLFYFYRTLIFYFISLQRISLFLVSTLKGLLSISISTERYRFGRSRPKWIFWSAMIIFFNSIRG
mgnify:CR=1 FL=1